MRPSPVQLSKFLRWWPVSILCTALLPLGIAACGSNEMVQEVVTATPEPTPAPTPPPLEPGRLFYLVLDEAVKVPAGPSWSPLHRNLEFAPTRRPSPEVLRDDGAHEDVAGGLADWLAGRTASAEQLLLVQWSMSWGSEGEAGTARRWGVCSLPCTLEDGFHAGKDRHPADPLKDALALFAARAGARDLEVSVDADALRVRMGDIEILRADGTLTTSEMRSSWKIATAAPDGALSKARASSHGRALRVATWSVEDLPIEVRSEASANTARLYPDLSGYQGEVPPRVRGVEGVAQDWPWDEASKFEGQFGVRPLPSDQGLTVERADALVRWVPSARQAGEGTVKFPLYSASRGGVSAVFKPFPRGVEAYGSTVGVLDGAKLRVRVAGPALDASMPRAHEVLAIFNRFQKNLPLPNGLPEEVLVYLSAQPVGVLDGGAGEASFSMVVDERRGEEVSVARAWARLLLGANVRARGAMTADWSRWVEARLLSIPDRSLWTSVFASSGEDVLEVWSEWMTKPEFAGDPDPDDFLRWAAGKIPALGAELYAKLPTRWWLLAHGLDALPEPKDGGVGVLVRSGPSPHGAALALRVPEDGLLPDAVVELVVSPGDGASFEWASQWLSEADWLAARDSAKQRVQLLEGWQNFGKVESESVPMTLPEVEAQGAVLALFLRGEAAWSGRVQLRVVSAPN